MPEVSSMAVIGAGTMGSGIALAAATSGIPAYLIDVVQEQLDRAKAYHAKTLSRSVVKQRMTQTKADEAVSRISYHTEMADAGDADWAIEAVLEEIGLKKNIFRQMQKTFREDVVLATNTSSISISDIAASVGEAAGRVIGMHFFNPVPVMKLVEVIKGRATSEQTTSRTMARINDAFYAWMEGVAEPQHIDEIMKLGCSFPMGPLRLADYIGLDVCVMILNVMRDGLGSDKYAPCPKLLKLVEQGCLGDKTGRGVYEYSQK